MKMIMLNMIMNYGIILGKFDIKANRKNIINDSILDEYVFYSNK